jgi:hypothetical protein
MPFVKGQSGNPAGRPRGCRNKANRDLDIELDGEATHIARSFVSKAKDGDPTAMRLVAQRVMPVGRERPVEIDLPPLRSAEDRPAAVAVIQQALCEGEITIREASALLNFVDQALGLNQPVARGRAETNDLRGEIANLRGMVAVLIGRVDVLRRINEIDGGPAPLGEDAALVNIRENTSAAGERHQAAAREINESDEIEQINEINEINAQAMTETPSAPQAASPAGQPESLNSKQNSGHAGGGERTAQRQISESNGTNEINEINAGSKPGAAGNDAPDRTVAAGPQDWQNEPTNAAGL